MKKFDQVKWGIIGVGNVCEVKSGPAFQDIDHSALVAVMRRNGELAMDYAKRHNVPKWYDDAHTLVNDPDINAIYIATPPNSHEFYVQMAAKAGKPVYVEKPMARSVIECTGMIETCKKAMIPLFVAYYRRSLPNFLKIKQLLDDHVIGDIRYVDLVINKTLEPDILHAAGKADNWRILPEIAGGGYFYDIGCHQLDIMDMLFGPISKISGFSTNQANHYPADDFTTASFQFENGIIGRGVWCFNSPAIADLELTTIVGSNGQISFPFFGDHSVTLALDGQRPERMEFSIPKSIQRPFIQTLVDDLRGIGKCPSTGESARRTNWAMEQICR